ncbi:MAG: hypothetical protein HY257_02905 [Chloroflexi bacterium]|nr:hypothetical protein [Chloroflexota bacterium]
MSFSFEADPPEGKNFSARSTVLRIKTDYPLKADEMFSYLLTLRENELEGVLGKLSRGDLNDEIIARLRMKRLGTTTEKSLALNPSDIKFPYDPAAFTKFWWSVLVVGAEVMPRACGQVYSFTWQTAPPPAAPVPPQQQPPQPPAAPPTATPRR